MKREQTSRNSETENLLARSQSTHLSSRGIFINARCDSNAACKSLPSSRASAARSVNSSTDRMRKIMLRSESLVYDLKPCNISWAAETVVECIMAAAVYGEEDTTLQTVDHFERRTGFHGGEDYECRVCLQLVNPAHTCMTLPCCDRTFHAECIENWLVNYKKTCPNCRFVF